MKRHSIIPIFIPHNGCENDCVFCNQRKITAKESSPSLDQTKYIVERNLKTINKQNTETVEIAFFGGSFTGIPISEQEMYLTLAKQYKEQGLIDKIRLSTRPDYIDESILRFLKGFGVDIIELGAQSLDDDVLRLSKRGHDSKAIIKASRLIKEYSIELGLQLMIGLPGDTKQKSICSAQKVVELNPEMVRLYPTVVLSDTELKEQMDSGAYKPFTHEEMIDTVCSMYEILDTAGIMILRVGLKSTDIINGESEAIYNDYHPAFRELVEGRITLHRMEDLIEEKIESNEPEGGRKSKIVFTSHPSNLSKLSGHKKENRNYLSKKYPLYSLEFNGDSSFNSDDIKVHISVS